MKGLLIAIFLGWAGGYRFYKKQKVLGFIYLFSFGLCFLGWIFDILMAFIEYKKTSKRSKNSDVIRPKTNELPDEGLSFDCEIKGVFSNSKKMPAVKRADLVASISVGSPLTLETAYYDGTPYFLVCVKGGLDIGSLPHELSRTLKLEYPDAYITAFLTDKTDLLHPKMKFTVYRG